jgi:sugar O-acyltransferase (sialic acid O-acetyltransferase NeuD family)
MQNLVVVGAGGHGRETVGSALLQLSGDSNVQLLGVLDDNPAENTQSLVEALGTRFLGPCAWLRTNDALFVIGIGSPSVRKSLDIELRTWGRNAFTVIHPRSSIGLSNHIGDGSIIAQGAILTTNIEIGRHVHLNVNSSVSHDSKIGAYTTISPGAVICGSCTLEEEVYIGANACVLQGVTIGQGAVVGAGACVTADVPPGQTVIGIPARPMKAK